MKLIFALGVAMALATPALAQSSVTCSQFGDTQRCRGPNGYRPRKPSSAIIRTDTIRTATDGGPPNSATIQRRKSNLTNAAGEPKVGSMSFATL